MWELWVKVYSGPNEDYSLWVSFSDSSEELLWRGKRGCQYIHDFGKGKYMPPSTYFFQKIAAGHEEQMSPLMILVFLRYETMQEIWLKKISWKYLTIWRPVMLAFLRPQSASFLIFTLNSFQGILKIRNYSGQHNTHRGRSQVTIFNWCSSLMSYIWSWFGKNFITILSYGARNAHS